MSTGKQKQRGVKRKLFLCMIMGALIVCPIFATRRQKSEKVDVKIKSVEDTESVEETKSIPDEGIEEDLPPEKIRPARKGSGQISYAAGLGTLSEAQEAVILSFMDDYYDSLAYMEAIDYFDSYTNEEERQWEEASLLFQLELRRMQPADYSLVSYEYELECKQISENEDGLIEIRASEHSVQYFAQDPEIAAERYGGFHYFSLFQVGDEWQIDVHVTMDAMLLTLLRNNPEIEENLVQMYTEFVPEYLEVIREQYEEREMRRIEFPLIPTVDHPYDRAAALAYAEQYAHVRNGKWKDYTGSGGNCQNYASQCLLAGGIPMDTVGAATWKWYDDQVSNGGGAYGRSSSWTGVEQFVDYASKNTGYGLKAMVDAPYYSGEPGDLIHMGTKNAWKHTVIISDLVQNERGETIDYLVNSNTGDLKNYPASLYGYPYMILTKVIGWNE